MSQNSRNTRTLRPSAIPARPEYRACCPTVWMLLILLSAVVALSLAGESSGPEAGPASENGSLAGPLLPRRVLPEEHSAFSPVDRGRRSEIVDHGDSLSQFTIGLQAFLTGSWHLEEERITEAVQELRRAMAADSGNADAALQLAQAFHQDGQLDSALVWSEEAMRLRPDDAAPARLAALTLVRLGRRQEALDRFLAVRRLDPDDITTVMNLMTLFEQMGRRQDALDLIHPTISPALELPSIYTRRARLLAIQGRPLEALADAAWALRKDPSFPDAEPLLHMLLDNMGDPPEAAQILEELLLEQPQMARVRLRLSRALIGSGDWENAVPHLEILSRARPDDAILARQLGIYYLRQGRLGESRESLLEASRLDPADPEPFRWLWRVENQAGRPEEAYGMAAALLSRSPGDEDAEVLQAVSLAQMDRKSEALTLSDKVLERDPTRRDAAFVSAALLEEFGRHSEAAGRLLPLLMKFQDDTELHLRLAGMLERAGDVERSLEVLDRLLELDPDNHMVLNHAGYICIERGVRLEEAVERVRRALELDPGNPAYMDSYGWGLYRLGDPSAALPYLRRAADALPTEPVVLKHLGEVKQATGDMEGAAAVYRRVLDLAPDDDEAAGRLRDLEDSLDAGPGHQSG